MLKILFIGQPNTNDYMQSMLYFGLRCLGHQVYDYPYIKTFHFLRKQPCNFGSCQDGPCNKEGFSYGCNEHPSHLTFDNRPFDIQEADLVVTNSGYGNEELFKQLMDKKICILDCGDSQISMYDEWVKCIGREPTAFFRRELLPGQKGYSLPFSFYDDRKIFRPFNELQYDVACMFRPTNPLRAEVAEIIKKEFPNSYIGTPKYPEYLDILSKSKFAIDMPGCGETTVRTTEIAGRGSVVVRPWQRTIVEDYDYSEDGEVYIQGNLKSCILDMKRILDKEYTYKNLRLRSWQHFNAYHTTTSRCLYLLDKAGF